MSNFCVLAIHDQSQDFIAINQLKYTNRPTALQETHPCIALTNPNVKSPPTRQQPQTAIEGKDQQHRPAHNHQKQTMYLTAGEVEEEVDAAQKNR